jgi:hypothetical protein
MEKTMRIPIGSQPAGIKFLLVEIIVLSIYFVAIYCKSKNSFPVPHEPR